MAEETTERLIRYLDDAWAVEKGLVTSLESMAKDVDDPAVSALFMQHREVTHQQEEDLEARIRALGKEPSGGKGFFHKMVQTIGEAMQAGHDDYDRTTQDLMKGFATENFEIAMYQALQSYALAIGDQETAALATRHLQQEREAAEKVWPLIGPMAARAAHAPRN